MGFDKSSRLSFLSQLPVRSLKKNDFTALGVCIANPRLMKWLKQYLKWPKLALISLVQVAGGVDPGLGNCSPGLAQVAFK